MGVGRWLGSLIKQSDIKLLNSSEYRVGFESSGTGILTIKSKSSKIARGGWPGGGNGNLPLAISNKVSPNDQISD